jgi:hypothetical protein
MILSDKPETKSGEPKPYGSAERLVIRHVTAVTAEVESAGRKGP